MADTSLLATAVNVFASPGEAFPVIRDKPRPVFPLFVVIIGVVIASLLYLSSVDLAWFLEGQIRASGGGAQLSDPEIVRAAETAASNPGFLMTISAVSTGIVLTGVFLIMSLYLWGASSIGKHGIRFIQAFALVCWTALPVLLGSIASVVNLLLNDATFMPQYLANPLSFASLLGIEPTPGDSGELSLLSLDLTTFWSIGLLTMGYRVWSGTSLGIALAIVLAPYAILFGFVFGGSLF